jgi:hypothetical protein
MAILLTITKYNGCVHSAPGKKVIHPLLLMVTRMQTTLSIIWVVIDNVRPSEFLTGMVIPREFNHYLEI